MARKIKVSLKKGKLMRIVSGTLGNVVGASAGRIITNKIGFINNLNPVVRGIGKIVLGGAVKAFTPDKFTNGAEMTEGIGSGLQVEGAIDLFEKVMPGMFAKTAVTGIEQIEDKGYVVDKDFETEVTGTDRQDETVGDVDGQDETVGDDTTGDEKLTDSIL